MKHMKHLFSDDQAGVLAAEYVIFVAAIGIILVVGVAALLGGMSDLFAAWSNYFQAPSGSWWIAIEGLSQDINNIKNL